MAGSGAPGCVPWSVVVVYQRYPPTMAEPKEYDTLDGALPLECYRPLEAFRKIPTFHEFAARLKVHGVAFLLIDRA